MAFNQNPLDDLIYSLLNVAGITATVGDRIYHARAFPGVDAVYPLCRYQVWNRFRPERTIGSSVSSYKGSYRVIGDFVENPRGAKDFAAAIEAAMVKSSYSALSDGKTVVDIYPQQYIYDEKDQLGDGKVYIMAGAIFDIEVTA